jgi:hypothetical protein
MFPIQTEVTSGLENHVHIQHHYLFPNEFLPQASLIAEMVANTLATMMDAV